MTDIWMDRLSEYLDDELTAEEQAALEVHLPACAACVRALEELRAVRQRAGALEDRAPAADLWPRILERIRMARRGPPRVSRVRPGWRRYAFSAPQLLAAGVALAMLSAGAAWLALRSPQLPAGGAALVGERPVPVAVAAMAGADYDRTVAQLEALLSRHRDDLDTATVRVLEESLASIDQAIADARSALLADPANSYLNLHLAGAMRRKLDLLRRAAQIATAAS